MVPYYFWGAYNITEMNSSTNVTRNPNVPDDKMSPARVFTANNTPSFVNSFDNLPMPTEDFVRNFGRRMHHMAVAVIDGHVADEKNVDYVVRQLGDMGTDFLAHVVGECKDEPNLKQIFSKSSAVLVADHRVRRAVPRIRGLLHPRQRRRPHRGRGGGGTVRTRACLRLRRAPPPTSSSSARGFAGVACAKHLGDAGVSVTLIDKNSYHQFQPLLYQVATAQLAPGDVMRPLRGLFRKHDVGQREARRGRRASTPSTREPSPPTTVDTFTGDHLVVSVGTEPNFFGIPGADEHAFPLYSALDAENLRNRMLRLFEDADLEPARLDQGRAQLRHRRWRRHRCRDGRGARRPHPRGDAGAVSRPRHQRGDDHARRPRRRRARPVLRQGPRLRGQGAREEGRRPQARRIGHRGRSRPCGVRRRQPHPVPVCRLGRRAQGPRDQRARGTAQRPRSGSASARISASMATPGCTPSATERPVSIPTGTRIPNSDRSPSRRAARSPKTILASIDGKAAPAFKYHDKGIMAMIGHGAAVAEMGKHHHELHGSDRLRRVARRARLVAQHDPRPDRRLHQLGMGLVLQQSRPGDHRRPRCPAHRLGRRSTPPTMRSRTGRRHFRIHRTAPARAATLMIENARTKVFWLMVVLTIVFVVLTVVHSIWWLIGVVIARRPRAGRDLGSPADEAQHPAQLPDRRPRPLPARGCRSRTPSVPRRERHRRSARSIATRVR